MSRPRSPWPTICGSTRCWCPRRYASALRTAERAGLASAPGALDPDGPAGPLAPIPGCDAIADTFCQYWENDPSLCKRSIREQLLHLESKEPSIARYVELDQLTADDGRPFFGIQIGALDGDSVPQLFLFGAQHAQEWASSGLTLEVVRFRVHGIDPSWPTGAGDVAFRVYDVVFGGRGAP